MSASAVTRSTLARNIRAACLPALLLLAPLYTAAQDVSPSSADVPTTLKVNSRLVLEDVLVTDAKGRPVHGLPRSAFHVYDQGRLQTIRNFEEGAPPSDATISTQSRVLPAGVFTNDGTTDGHTASEVLLIDADDLILTDQMFLLAQMRRSIATLPQGLQVAVFRVSGGRVVQIRGMTTDREDLQRALTECLPVQPHGVENKFESAVGQLMTVTAFLEQIPGRKNLLWFAGEFPLVPAADQEQVYGAIRADYADRLREIHLMQEALAEARIAVYPVDVRGVLTTGLAMPADRGEQVAQTRSMAAAAGFGRTPVVRGPLGDGNIERREQMRQLADATGGKAYMLNNLSEEIGEAFELGVRAYSLSYTPDPYATDDSWHKVKITVDGGYQVSYRSGYLASWTGIPGGRQGIRLEDGQRITTQFDTIHDPKQPVLFTAKIEPYKETAQPKSKTSRIKLRLTFEVPASQLLFIRNNETWKNELLICSYAYDAEGKMRGGKLQEIDTALTDEQWQRAQKQQLPGSQEIEVPKDAKYLLVAVRDKRSKRIGNLLLSMRAIRALSATP